MGAAPPRGFPTGRSGAETSMSRSQPSTALRNRAARQQLLGEDLTARSAPRARRAPLPRARPAPPRASRLPRLLSRQLGVTRNGTKKLRRSGQLKQLQDDRLQPEPQVEGLVGAVHHPSNPTVAGSTPAGRAFTRHHVLVHASLIVLVVRNRTGRSPDPHSRARGAAPPPATQRWRPRPPAWTLTTAVDSRTRTRGRGRPGRCHPLARTAPRARRCRLEASVQKPSTSRGDVANGLPWPYRRLLRQAATVRLM